MNTQFTPITQIASLPVGTPIPAIRGIVKTVFPVKTGTQRNGGSYKIQTLIITGDGGEVGFCLNRRDDAPLSVVGQEVCAYCVQGSSGPVGLKVSLNKHKNINELTVESDAVVEFGSRQSAPAHQQPYSQPQQRQLPPAQNRPAPYQHPTAAQNTALAPAPARTVLSPEDVMANLAKEEALMILCFRSANMIADTAMAESNGAFALSEGSIQDVATTLYITARREFWQAGL